ncbi:tetratricopeptide repeat protein [Mesonia sp. K7]|uniref:tetratricopeptide repeat protein n=1 Tax=Mesonia sp. K7 TaxID=2218606 RepID=UPI000DA8B654|nr:tetratricopeptide repeat protein [Mesonia sp. K7]PZD78722.1 hypothetical protein DNG35_04530 [Mesonia sp. K7]
MEKEEYIAKTANLETVNHNDLHELDLLLAKYPYFQSARAMRLKLLKNTNSFEYNFELKRTAAYTSDRTVLFDFITSVEFDQNQLSQEIKARETEEASFAAKQNSAVSEKPTHNFEMEDHEVNQVLDPELFQTKSNETEIEDEDKIELERSELEIGKPLEFDQTETHSFTEWLKLTSMKPIVREKSEKEQNFELIDKFIKENPKINPSKENSPTVPVLEPSSTNLMTETLARVYLEQKKYDKAIQAYKILILKYPEKSSLFANQIRAIENLKE